MNDIRNIVQDFENLFQSVPGAFCVRDYYAQDGEERLPIRVVIYPPVAGETGPTCRYTIEGAGLAIDSLTIGFDRLEATLNSFFAVRAALEELPYDVAWIGQPRMLSLPKQLASPFGAHFERHCEELIDAEQAWAAAKKGEARSLWVEFGKRYEDCQGYKNSRTRAE